MPGSWSTLRWVSGNLEKPQVPLVLCLFSSLHRVPALGRGYGEPPERQRCRDEASPGYVVLKGVEII